MSPGISCRCNHAFDAAVSETARYENSIHISKFAVNVSFFQTFRIDPLHVHMDSVAASCVIKRFEHRKICVVQTGVLTHKTDPYNIFTALYPLHHRGPLCHVRFRGIYTELPAYYT